MSIFDWLGRNARPRREPSHAGPVVPCSVIGVYATVHLEDGRDYDTDLPYKVEIDCEMTTFYLPIRNVPFTGRLKSSTLHLGVVNVELGITDMEVRKGADLVVIHAVSMASMSRNGGPLPDWTRPHD